MRSTDRRVATFLRYIAANTRNFRAARRMTQEQLAELAGVDLTFLQRVEAAKANLSVGVLVAIADALDVHPRMLFSVAEMSPPRRGRPPTRSK